MMPAPLTLGIVGAGAIAGAYVEAARQSPGIQVTAVADLDRAAAERLAGIAGCPSFESVEALVASGLCEAALIASPPSTHADIACTLMDAGVHTLCEKPFAISSEDAIRMARFAASQEIVLTMSSKFRYVADVMLAKEILHSGLLGEMVFLENSFTDIVDMSGRWNSDPEVSGGGVLIDNGAHSVDIARHFLGPIDRVMAVAGPLIQDLPVEDNAQLFVRTAESRLGTIDLSWSMKKTRDSYIDVYCTNGAISIRWQNSVYKIGPRGDWVEFGTGYAKLEALRSQLENFAGAVRGTEALVVTAFDAIASVEVIAAAYRSMEENRWINVDDPLADDPIALATGRVVLDSQS